MYKKKIYDISEIWDGKELLIKDFSDLDLETLDLSEIPMDDWKDSIFYNTNFRGTNIKFKPNLLKVTSGKTYYSRVYDNPEIAGIFMCNCDFSNNDLSYIKKEDFYSEKTKNYVCFEGCNFKNTMLIELPEMIDVIVDDYFLELDYSDLDCYGEKNCLFNAFIDLNTIRKNPQLKLPSLRFLKAAWGHCYYHSKDLTKEELVTDCESILKLDRQGHYRTFYGLFKDDMNMEEKYKFFLGQIEGLYLKNIEIKNIPLSVLSEFRFAKNTFDNVIVDMPLGDTIKFSDGFLYDIGGNKNIYKSLYFPSITYDSWQENISASRRIGDSSITFLTKVYIELSRLCNGKCSFCRNQSFDNCDYNLDAITSTLDKIKKYVNSVVIGGGEPTLRLNDVKLLRAKFMESDIDFHMFTNGTNSKLIDDEYIMENFKINLSRHAIDDLENANIFKADVANMMSIKDIEELNKQNSEVTLNATCFKGGLDSFDKIISYLSFARDIGCKKVLIQDLQKSMSLGNNDINCDNLCIDENIFPRVINYLKANGFKQKHPIYATGGYVAYVFRDKNDFTISIQRYITKEELYENWFKAIKRTFDLSIAPTGELYENWHQTSGMVKTLKN